MDENMFKPFTTSLIGSLPRSKELLMLKESSMKSEKYSNVYLEKYIEMLKTGGKVRKYRCFKNCRSRLRK